MASMLAEDVDRERVKGAEQGAVGVSLQAPVHPVPHLGGGLVGERQGEDRGVVVFFQ